MNTSMKVNTGFIAVDPRPGDFISGGETGMPELAINTGADWRRAEPEGEWQKLLGVTVNGGQGFETDACVSFSADDSLESFGDFCITQNLWPAEAVQWLRDNGYFNSLGQLNFSDRFTARMSNTTINGNSLPNVGDCIRKYGLVPESAWPFPIDEIKANPGQAWAIYYRDVPASVQALGLEFKKHFQTFYEWVIWPGSGATPVSIASELTRAPIQIATAVCSPWNTDQVIAACGPGTAHATMLSHVEIGVRYDILDHYVPFDKHFAIDYSITYGMRYAMVPVAQIPVPPSTFHYTFTKQLTYNGKVNDAVELKALQTALQTLRRADGSTYMKPGVFGPFGPQTRTALDLFERDHHIVDPQPGQNFGPTNRATMNALLK